MERLDHKVWDSGLIEQFTVSRMPSVLGCILPFFMLILLRGSLLQASSFLFFILVFGVFVRRGKPDPAVLTAQRPVWETSSVRTSYAAA